MNMNLIHQTSSSSFPFMFHTYFSTNPSSKPPLFLSTSNSKPSPSFSISASSHSSSPIFLPFLQQEEQETDNPKSQELQNEEVEEDDDDDDVKDPIIRFFKSRPSTPDPPRQGRLSLQKNRRSSWHLAPDIRSLSDPESDSKPEPDGEDKLSEAKEQTDYMPEDSTELLEGIVGEIVRIAKNLPENSTLGEFLGRYQGKLSEIECWEVLVLMEKEGLHMGCLYFFEWMGLQEPSLVTPRACSILFPALGRAGMGDKLMVFFRNLPQSKAFRDVHVYNAAISGLFCSKR